MPSVSKRYSTKAGAFSRLFFEEIMQQRLAVELEKSYRLLNHGPTVLVSSAFNGRQNVMAAAWSMPLDFSPPKVTVVIDRNTLTRELVEGSGEFVLNIPTREQARIPLGGAP